MDFKGPKTGKKEFFAMIDLVGTNASFVRNQKIANTVSLSPVIKKIIEVLEQSPDKFIAVDERQGAMQVDVAGIVDQLSTPKESIIGSDSQYSSGYWGGLLPENEEGNTRKAIFDLNRVIEKIIQERTSDEFYKNLVYRTADEFMIAMAKPLMKEKTVKGVPKGKICFYDTEIVENTPAKKVGKVIVCHECLDKETNLFDIFAAAMKKEMEQRIAKLYVDEDEKENARKKTERVCGYIRKMHEITPQDDKKDLHGFFEFLDDFGFSILRVAVTLEVMTRLAAKDTMLSTYVQKVKDLIRYVSKNQTVISAKVLGDSFEIGLGNMAARKIYDFLPVWIFPTPEIDENRNDSWEKYFVSRTMPYRMKIGGKTEDGYAFDVKVKKIKNNLLEYIKNIKLAQTGDMPQKLINSAPYNLAEAIVLYVLASEKPVAKSLGEIIAFFDKRPNVGQIQQYLEKNIFPELESHSFANGKKTFYKIGQELVQCAKSRILDTRKIHARIVVSKDIVDWDNLRDYNVIRKPKTKYNIEWARCIRVILDDFDSLDDSEDSKEVSLYPEDSLISFDVNIELREYNLSKKSKMEMDIQRQGDVPVIFTRMSCKKDSKPKSISFAYNNEHFKNPMFKTAVWLSSAYSIIMLAFLNAITRVAKKQFPDVHMLISRTHENKKNNNLNDNGNDPGNDIYAISKAVEFILLNTVPTRVQGFCFEDFNSYKKDSTFLAFSSLFPTTVQYAVHPETPRRVAVLCCISRPSSMDTSNPSAETKYLFSIRTYVSQFENDRMTTSLLRMQTRAACDKATDALMEELRILKKENCSHVAILFKHFGGRHFNKSASRNSPHSRADVFSLFTEEMKDIVIYPLRLDKYSVIRGEKRGKDVGHFEVTDFSSIKKGDFAIKKGDFADIQYQDKRAIIPIYSFGTLHIVGKDKEENDRPQSNMTTYCIEVDGNISDRSVDIYQNIKKNPHIRNAIIASLRSIHYMESERNFTGVEKSTKGTEVFLPCVAPFRWMEPTEIQEIGEIKRGNKTFSVYAALSRFHEISKANQ